MPVRGEMTERRKPGLPPHFPILQIFRPLSADDQTGIPPRSSAVRLRAAIPKSVVRPARKRR